MATNLAKILTLLVFCLCDGISLPFNEEDKRPIEIRVKKSAINNFSFGFGIKTPFAVPNPITSLQEPINNLRNFLKPINQNENFNMGQAPLSQIYDNTQSKMNILKMLDNSGQSTNSPNHNSNLELLKEKTSPSISNNIKPEIKNKTKMLLQNDTTSISLEKKIHADKNDTVFETTTSIKNSAKEELLKKIDNNLLDYIFQMNTTEETTTVDFTTETGDYETTTYEGDDLLRIPGPVVASLLG